MQNHTDGQLIGAYDHIKDCDLDDRIIYILGKKNIAYLNHFGSDQFCLGNAQHMVSLQYEVSTQLLRGHQCPGKCGDNPLEGGVGKLKRLWEG